MITAVYSCLLLSACANADKPSLTQQVLDNKAMFKTAPEPNTLRVATLNLAHGRKDSFSQFFVTEKAFKQNLNDISEVINKYQIDIIAFQEADQKSWSSGGFDHVDFIKNKTGFIDKTHAINIDSWFASYGTAIISKKPITDSVSYTFAPSPPTFSKGFSLAQIESPCNDGSHYQKIDIISVHLDFLIESTRDKQITEMKKVLGERNNPTIIMGDFNSEWLTESSVISKLATQSNFHTYQPESQEFSTYGNKRLDWIVMTKDIEFIDFTVVPDTLSDHKMVVADIRLPKDCRH